jgi:hypothetical protein
MKSTRGMMKSIFGLFVLLLLCISLAPAGLSEKDKAQGPQKTNTNDLYRPFLINNVFNYYSNNGDGSFNKFSTDNEGFEFLKGTGKHVIFEDGVVWGGYHKGRATPKVGGSVYRHGLQAGPIVTNGTLTTDPVAASSTDPLHRIFRIRPDINPGTPFAEVQAKIESEEIPFIGRYESYSAQDIYDQYVKDWNEWPATLGAPYKDLDSNGVYDPTKDIPGQPGADQTLWYVSNDMNAAITNNLAGSPPIGLEMRRTIWGYRRKGALGQTIFASSLIINKSGAPIDSMHLVQWSDPDLGDAGDDYAGCDTSRSLGYIYNGGLTDLTYGVAVPAGGFDFFQGPIVPAPGDSAIFRLKRRYGVKNLPMTTFDFFSQGFANFADPIQGPGGDIQWWRLMNATAAPSGVPFIDPTTGNPSSGQAVKFCLYGDPVKATDGSAGWVDGLNGLTPQDRRICLVTGPFTMAPGDTQELVVALVGGVGSDRLSSIAVLRAVDDKAQSAYNNLFVLPAPPPSPVVSVANLNNEVILTWGSPAGITKTEGSSDQGFHFEGYKVYEYPGPSTDGQIEIGTFDLANGIQAIPDTAYDPATQLNLIEVVQKGTDNGIIRSIDFKSSKVTGSPMVDGTPYYFAVTAYSYNANPPAAAGTHALESPAQVFKVVPQTTNPGVRYTQNAGDTVKSITHAGASDGKALARVVNPAAVTGDSYKIVFATLAGNPVWHLVRTHGTVVDTVAKNQTDQSGTDAGAIIVDGVEFRVSGAPNDFKFFEVVANAGGALNPTQAGSFAFNGSGFPLPPSGADRPDGTKQQTTGLTLSQGWGIHTGMNSTSMPLTYANFVTRVTNGGARWPLIVPYDFEIRFTAAGGKALLPADFTGDADTLIDVPFELWNIGINTPANAADDYRMFPNILDADGNRRYNLLTAASVAIADNGGGGATHSISGGANDPFTDWVYWAQPTIKTPGQAGYNAVVAGAQAAIAGATDPYLGTGTDGTDVIRRQVLVGWNFGTVASGTYAQQMPQTGTVFRITSTKPNTPSDAFTIVAPTVAQSTDVARADVTLINVFPNPYLGFNPLEINKYARFVTFNHMPAKATVRVFNLAGVLVRTMQKSDPSQFFQWDLTNDSGFPVAAGMYIIHIDMPDLGSTKILKLGVVPEQQYLDRW